MGTVTVDVTHPEAPEGPLEERKTFAVEFVVTDRVALVPSPKHLTFYVFSE